MIVNPFQQPVVRPRPGAAAAERASERAKEELPELLSPQNGQSQGQNMALTVLVCSKLLSSGLLFSRQLSSEHGTYTTVKAGFWPWLSGESP